MLPTALLLYIHTPIAEITNAGPGFMLMLVKSSAVLRFSIFFLYNSLINLAPMGYPQKRERNNALPQLSLAFRIFDINWIGLPLNSSEFTQKIDKTVNMYKEGIMVLKHTLIPFATPSAISLE